MKTTTLATLAAFALLGLLLSGCTASNGPNGQSATAPGSIAYNGASTGTDKSAPFECDGSGKVHVLGNLGSGSVTVTVQDSSGKAVYTKVIGAPGQTDQTDDVTGLEGQWSLTGARSSGGGMYGSAGFSGQYTATVQC